jgi:uncharacterized membrane protein
MISALEILATLASGLFAGAALYVNVAEHPARMELETRAAVSQWAPSYKRATWLQAPLAVLSFVTGGAAWILGAGTGWLWGAMLIGSVVPFTFIAIMPTNHKLLDPARDSNAPETRTLLNKWSQLHAVRTALSMIAFAVYLWMLREA